jgi:hypothetical protein
VRFDQRGPVTGRSSVWHANRVAPKRRTERQPGPAYRGKPPSRGSL